VLGSSKSILKTYDGFLRSSGFGQPDVQGMRNPFFAKYTRLVVRRKEIVEEPIPVDYIEPMRLHFDRSMLDMLNVKYIISNSPIHDPNYSILHDSSFFVYENMSVLSRAFFVDSVYVLPGRRAIFDAMRAENFDPRHIAFLEQEPPFHIFNADSNIVNIVSWRPGRIELQADVKQPRSLVLSTVYYPVGWQAYVDEHKSDLYKTNYFMRSLFLKPGVHTIRLQFLPKLFKIGAWVSLFSFSLCIILLSVGIVLYSRQNSETAEAR
jgi:hypothetical protein